MKFWKQTFLAAVASVACHASVNAALVETWTIDTSAKWISATAERNGALDEITDTRISWGEETTGKWEWKNGKFQYVTQTTPGSALEITNPGPLSLNTTLLGGDSAHTADSVALTHINMPIPGETLALSSASLSVAMLVKDASDMSGSFIDLGAFAYDIKFVETPNEGRCAVQSPTRCSDIFVLTSGSLEQTFEYNDVTYFVEAFPINPGTLSVLSDAACRAASAAVGCVGFATPENEITTLQFGLSITAISFRDIVTDPAPEQPMLPPQEQEPSPQQPTPVSEPAALAVLGLALFGAGLGRRRAKAAA